MRERIFHSNCFPYSCQRALPTPILTAVLALGVLLSLAAPARPEEAFPAQLRLESETLHYRLYEVRFPSAVESPFEANNTVWGHLYLPRVHPGERPPCVLVLPVMAAPNVWIEMRFVRALLRQGIAAMWIEMPYQFNRRPHDSMPSGRVFLARNADVLGRNFRQSVSDARRALTWLAGSGLVDGDRLGLFGVSLGALVGASAYSVDDRPAGAVFLLGGADFTDLVFRSDMTAEFARRAGIGKEELRRAWKGIDPLEHRDRNRGKRVFLVNTRHDLIIPEENALKLKEAFPDSHQLMVPLGHYGAVLHLLWAPSYAARRFSELLGPSASVPSRR